MDSISNVIQEITKNAGNGVLPAVRQLAVPDSTGDKLIPAGSAVLIWHRGSRFVLTAAHVVNLYPDCSYYLGTDTSWVDIGRTFTMPREQRDQDFFDFAFHRVDDVTAAKFDGCAFLTADNVITRDEPVFQPPYRSKYFAVGYPLNRFEMDAKRKVTTPKTLMYTGAIATPQQYLAAKRDPRQHIVLDFKSRAVIGPKGVQRSPKLSGLSGGGLFTLPAMQHLGDPRNPQLAGLTIEQVPEQRVLIGIRIEFVHAAIDKSYPNSMG